MRSSVTILAAEIDPQAGQAVIEHGGSIDPITDSLSLVYLPKADISDGTYRHQYNICLGGKRSTTYLTYAFEMSGQCRLTFDYTEEYE